MPLEYHNNGEKCGDRSTACTKLKGRMDWWRVGPICVLVDSNTVGDWIAQHDPLSRSGVRKEKALWRAYAPQRLHPRSL